MTQSTERAPEALPAVQEARDTLARTAQVARLGNDPMVPFLEALSVTLDAQHQLFVTGAQGMAAAAQAARQPIDGDAVAYIGKMVAESAHKRAVELAMELAREQARAHWRRDLAVLFGLLLAIGIAAFAGYREGWAHGIDAVHETEAGLREAFARGGLDAAGWLRLMRWNRADAALALCKGPTLSVQNGRKACVMPFWIEPPKSSQPNG